ncbi:MAG: hypothetical protein H0V44_11075 [Planctomycetes bacterium]|nr:hypothetical protein [Planctomycetota bacterium]
MDTTHGGIGASNDRVRQYERIMCELLNAAHADRRKRLSTLAAAEIAGTSAGNRAEYRRTALILKEKCVLLGSPEERYRTPEWRARGL